MSFNPFSGGDVSETLGDVVGRSEESATRQAFSRDFNTENFDSFGGDVTPGKFIELARFQVPSDTEYAIGYGRAANPENQGYQFVDLQDGTPSAVEGTLRYKVESSTGRQSEVVADFDTERLSASKTNREQQVPLPEQVGSSLATEDSFIVLELDAASSATVSASNSEVIIPLTEYDLTQ
jgi:hypothetical protein